MVPHKSVSSNYFLFVYAQRMIDRSFSARVTYWKSWRNSIQVQVVFEQSNFCYKTVRLLLDSETNLVKNGIKKCIMYYYHNIRGVWVARPEVAASTAYAKIRHCNLNYGSRRKTSQAYFRLKEINWFSESLM